MDSAKIFGSEEESHSCESGWTMYLVSPSHDHDDYYYDDDDDDAHHYHHQDEDSDDDSMASDASSGPIEGTSHLKHHHEAEAVNYGFYLTKKTEKPVNKKMMMTNQSEAKQEMLFDETKVNNMIHNSNDHDDDDDDDGDDGDDGGSVADHSYVGSIKLTKSKRN